MPQRDQHTANDGLSQAQLSADQCWDDLVKQRLPDDLHIQARAQGAFQRVREVPNAQALLRALLCYVLSLSSLKQLSGWSRLSGITTKVLSAQAWHRHVQKAAPWLLWLFADLLRLRLPIPTLPGKQRILLVDATFLNEMGPKGDLWRLHCAYDLLAGKLAWVRVTDRSVGESLAHLPVQAGDILIGDKAYSKAPQLVAVDAAQAFSLTRFSPWHLPVYASQAPQDTPAFRIDIRQWLIELRPGTYERRGVVIADGKRVPVRLIAVVFPDEQAEALRQQRLKQAREKGSKLSEQSLFLAGFHLLVTTLPENRWPCSLVLELYRCRWHIEILFKRIKQVLDTHRLPCRCPQTATAMIAALLVAWLLIEDEAAELRRQIADGEGFAVPLSNWQLNQWALMGLQNVIKGWWSPMHVLALAAEFRRVFSDKRQRPLREPQRQRRFHALVAGEPDLVSVFDCSSA